MSKVPASQSYPLIRDHYTIFGSIVHLFARVEWHMQLTIAAISKTDLDKILIFTKELSYRQKRDTLYSYLTLTSHAPDYVKRSIKDFLDEIDGYNVLRNNIAHAVWTRGKRPGSIKPMTIIIRGGKGKIIGRHDADERDYTLKEFDDIVLRFQRVANSYVNFLYAEELFAAMRQKIDASIEAMTSAPGAIAK